MYVASKALFNVEVFTRVNIQVFSVSNRLSHGLAIPAVKQQARRSKLTLFDSVSKWLNLNEKGSYLGLGRVDRTQFRDPAKTQIFLVFLFGFD